MEKKLGGERDIKWQLKPKEKTIKCQKNIEN